VCGDRSGTPWGPPGTEKLEYRDGYTPRESHGPGNGHRETMAPPGEEFKKIMNAKNIKNSCYPCHGNSYRICAKGLIMGSVSQDSHGIHDTEIITIHDVGIIRESVMSE
jgi:hypothetical protein